PKETTVTVSYEAGKTGEQTIPFGEITYDKVGTYTYTITEDELGDGWSTTGNNATVTVEITDNGDGTLSAEVTGNKTITNEYTVLPSELTVEKSATPSKDVKEGEEVTYTVEIVNSGKTLVKNIVLSDTLVDLDEEPFDLEPGQKKTITYTYTVTKADVEAGYIENAVTATGEDPKGDDVTGEDEFEVSIKKEETPPYVPSHVNIHVYKVWKNDGDVAAETRPTSVTVVLLKDGKPVAKTDLNEKNNWHCEWHREDSRFYDDFTVQELPVDGYATSIEWKVDGNNLNGGRIYTVTNTLTNLIDDHVAYIIGYPDGTVRPNRSITRAEVATIFFRLLTDEARDRYWSQTNSYVDVMPEAWYNNAISTLSNMGIINGYEDGTFRPDNPITRAELTKIAVSFFGSASNDFKSSFTDVNSNAWYSSFIAAAEDRGLVNGYGDNTFHPDDYITRAETCAIVNRTLKRAPHKDYLLPGYVMNVFPDNLDTSAWYFADVQEATNSHDYSWIQIPATVEKWVEKLPERDWAAMERFWSTSHSAPGNEVMN
ncbi:MAG: S-layer homology domain-containing protein, partial [Clostridiales bacterium]|nr:S-layer homology domain-containing protein [Clostridiales bacterium]